MQAMCENCYEEFEDWIHYAFPTYKDAGCGKTWACCMCGKQTSMVLQRNCKIME